MATDPSAARSVRMGTLAPAGAVEEGRAMLVALTVRKLKPGSLDAFAEAFTPDRGNPPAGWKQFNLVRDVQDENRVITFGFFDGTLEEMQSSQDDHGYAERRTAAEEHVEAVEVNGIFEGLTQFNA